MTAWPDDWKGWSGGIEDLAQAASAVLADAVPADAEEINERTIRYYQSEGAVGRGQREGKTARYGFRELAELVATRRLMAEGWRLATIAKTLPGLGDDELANSPAEAKPVPDPARARSVIAGLRGGAPARAAQPASFAAQAYARTVERSAGPGRPDAVRAVREFRPAPWLTALVADGDLAGLDDAVLDAALAELRRLLRAEADEARRRR